MTSLTINVVGTPAPQGSKKGFVVNGRVVMTESSKKVKPWRQDVAAAVRETTDNMPGFESLTGPVSVSVVFYMPRPGYHFGTGRNAGVLKHNAPVYVDKKPDCDKLLRSVLDALTTSGVIRDDAQVASLTGIKEYANAATGARIQIAPFGRPTSTVAPMEQETLL